MMIFALVLLSGMLFLVSGVMLLVAAFRKGILWGIACLLLPPVQLVFIVLHWDVCKKVVGIWLVGLLILVVLVSMGGESFVENLQSQMATYAPQQHLPPDWQEKPAVLVPEKARQLLQAITETESQPAGLYKVYRCRTSGGGWTFADFPLPGQTCEEKVLADPASAALETPVPQPVQGQSSSHFHCDGRTMCSQMTSCEEARYFLANCPDTKMDGDRDGIPCESQWCG